jgi:hypothetical protein
MTRALSKDEEEGVLSSIRRLVGNNNLNAHTANSDVSPRPPCSDKLVLTPRLRVAEDPVSNSPVRNDNVFVLGAHHARAAMIADEAAKTGRALAKRRSMITVEDEKPATGRKAAQRPARPRRPTLEIDASVLALSEKIAALETAIANSPEQWEPDDAGTDAYAGTRLPAMEWPDPESDKAAPAAPAATSIAIDEDTLRTMVSSLVRAELKGPLGDRLSRNIRALVRREIERALEAQRSQ